MSEASSGPATSGFLPPRVSSPSGVPSLSVSLFFGSVPKSASSQSFSPSLSESSATASAVPTEKFFCGALFSCLRFSHPKKKENRENNNRRNGDRSDDAHEVRAWQIVFVCR